MAHFYKTVDEWILCAAIWYKTPITPMHTVINCPIGVVMCGHRHPHIIGQLKSVAGKRSVTSEVGEYEQGFLTNKNRFVSREEAATIAFAAHQIEQEKKQLYSEDIY
jgi:hypothetical protein